MNVVSVRTIANSIKYKVEFQLQTITDPQKLLTLDTVNLMHLINYGYAIDDNVRTLRNMYGNIVSIPAKKKLSAVEKFTLKEKG